MLNSIEKFRNVPVVRRRVWPLAAPAVASREHERLDDAARRYLADTSPALAEYNLLPMLLVGPRSRFIEVCRWLDGSGFEANVFDRLETAIVEAASHSALVVDLDHLGGIVRAAGPLMALRKERPDLPVILMGGDVDRDDASTYRLPLGDATLRRPVSVQRFEVALSAAARNNVIWQERLDEIEG